MHAHFRGNTGVAIIVQMLLHWFPMEMQELFIQTLLNIKSTMNNKEAIQCSVECTQRADDTRRATSVRSDRRNWNEAWLS